MLLKKKNARPYPIDIREKSGVRSLHFGSTWIQGAMRIGKPWALELDYTREMMFPLLLRPLDWPRRVLLVGLGAASLTKFLYRHRPQAVLDVVEIDERVVAAASMYFNLPHDPARISLTIKDAADFVGSDTTLYDLILVDGFDAEAQCGRLVELPFYRACRTRLHSGGILAANLFSSRKSFRRHLTDLATAFDRQMLALPPCATGNVIALAGNGKVGALSFNVLHDNAVRLLADTALDLLPTLTRLVRAGLLRNEQLIL